MDFRVGFGYDVHKLAKGYKLFLGGIEIEHTMGLVGHSDADVLIHAICDALLGAVNMHDIGYHFSDKDPKYKGIDSKKLLVEVVRMIGEKGWYIGNIDTTIAAQQPKLAPHIPLMKTTLAEVIGCEAEQVSVKATTTEKLGFEGRQEGISAYAVVMVKKD